MQKSDVGVEGGPIDMGLPIGSNRGRWGQLRYRVRARDARIRVMHANHPNSSLRNEAVEPRTIAIIARKVGGVYY